MSRPYAVGLLILLGLLLLAAMWWGWRRRVARTGADLAPGADTLGDGDDDDDGDDDARLSVPGVYVSTTSAADWLDRIAADGLGARSPVRAEVRTSGLALLRTGAPDVLIPSSELAGARRERGIAGKVTGAGGLVVVRWRRGDREFDTGIRTRFAADRDRLTQAINAITPAPPTPHVSKDAA